jgi:hypothetical protein
LGLSSKPYELARLKSYFAVILAFHRKRLLLWWLHGERRASNPKPRIKMKYFTANENGKEEIIGSASAAKQYLRAHPEVQEVTRYWWSGNDLIECEEYDREKLLGKTVRELNSGATAQWCVHHGVR